MDNDVHFQRIRRLKIFTYSFMILWVAVAMPLIILHFNYSSDFSRQRFSQSMNGLWLEHRWVGEAQTSGRFMRGSG